MGTPWKCRERTMLRMLPIVLANHDLIASHHRDVKPQAGLEVCQRTGISCRKRTLLITGLPCLICYDRSKGDCSHPLRITLSQRLGGESRLKLSYRAAALLAIFELLLRQPEDSMPLASARAHPELPFCAGGGAHCAILLPGSRNRWCFRGRTIRAPGGPRLGVSNEFYTEGVFV